MNEITKVTAGTVAPPPVTGITDTLMAAFGDLQHLAPDVYSNLQRQIEKAGAHLVVTLQTHQITVGRFANRHADSYETQDFKTLRNSIQDSGGNLIPILVRMIERATAANVAQDDLHYEVIAGHRRLEACRTLRLPVKAIVLPSVSDAQVAKIMFNENEARVGLTAYEAGAMYRRWLDEKLFPSQNKLAEAIGRSAADVSRALALAGLPGEILDLVESRLYWQYRDADDIRKMLDLNADAVMQAAAKLAAEERKKSRVQVLQVLSEASSLHGGVGPSKAPRKCILRAGEAEIGKARWDASGSGQISIARALSPQAQAELETLVAGFVARELGLSKPKEARQPRPASARSVS